MATDLTLHMRVDTRGIRRALSIAAWMVTHRMPPRLIWLALIVMRRLWPVRIEVA